MFKYRCHYLADSKDPDYKTYESETELKVGDVIELHFFHCITAIHVQKTGVRLDLSKSAQDPEEAVLLAKQLEHLR